MLNVYPQARKHTFFSVFAPPCCGADQHAPPLQRPLFPLLVPREGAPLLSPSSNPVRLGLLFSSTASGVAGVSPSLPFSRIALLCLWLLAIALLGKVVRTWLCMCLREGVHVSHSAC